MRIFLLTTLFILISVTALHVGTDVAEAQVLDSTPSSSYTPMVDIPGVTPGTGSSFTSYVNALYGIAIVAAALLAVIRLVIAGAKYMMSDVVTTKGQAISDIQGSLIGLLIIISAVVILQTINPRLSEINLVGPQQPGIGGMDLSSIVGVGYSAPVGYYAIPDVSCIVPTGNTGSGVQCTQSNCSGNWIQVRPGYMGCEGTITSDTSTGIGGTATVQNATLSSACTSVGCDDMWDYLDANYAAGYSLERNLTGPYIDGFTTYTAQELQALDTQCTGLGANYSSVVFERVTDNAQFFGCVSG